MALRSLIPFILSLNYQSPGYLFLIIPLIALVWFLALRTVVHFDEHKKEKWYAQFLQRKLWLRGFVLITRTLAVILIVVSLASPYLITDVQIPGDKNVKILVDQSDSFSLFDQSAAKKLEENLKKLFPTSVSVIASGTESHLADEILSALSLGDNIFLVTDGNDNGERSLEDLGFYATALNASVHGINVVQVKDDASISLLGPSKTVSNVENNFYVVIDNPQQLSYTVVVTIDGVEVLREDAITKMQLFLIIFFMASRFFA